MQAGHHSELRAKRVPTRPIRVPHRRQHSICEPRRCGRCAFHRHCCGQDPTSGRATPVARQCARAGQVRDGRCRRKNQMIQAADTGRHGSNRLRDAHSELFDCQLSTWAPDRLATRARRRGRRLQPVLPDATGHPSTASASRPPALASTGTAPGSRSPERVGPGTPPSGVSAIVVSRLMPSATAQTLHPPPSEQTRRGPGGCWRRGRPPPARRKRRQAHGTRSVERPFHPILRGSAGGGSMESKRGVEAGVECHAISSQWPADARGADEGKGRRLVQRGEWREGSEFGEQGVVEFVAVLAAAPCTIRCTTISGSWAGSDNAASSRARRSCGSPPPWISARDCSVRRGGRPVCVASSP